jgi:hypothetical protein
MEKELGHEVFEEERRRIEASGELAAKDVTVLLKRADVVLDNGERGTFRKRRRKPAWSRR